MHFQFSSPHLILTIIFRCSWSKMNTKVGTSIHHWKCVKGQWTEFLNFEVFTIFQWTLTWPIRELTVPSFASPLPLFSFFPPFNDIAHPHDSHRKSLPHRQAPQPPVETDESRFHASESRVDAGAQEADRVSAGSSSGSGANYEYPSDPGLVASPVHLRGDEEEDPEPPSYPPPPPPPEEEEDDFANG